MLDHLIKQGTIVDGTGRPPQRGDVAIQDGRIVAIGQIDDRALRVIDAEDLVVSPGFVDPHTHYDAQLFWDGLATPSNVHGVTSTINGNCGFTLAPLKPEDADFTLRMLSVVEGMSIAALEDGIPHRNWTSFGEYLDLWEGSVAVNVGFMVGHCAIRQYVMGDDAIDQQATPEQVTAMVRLLDESLAAGGLGLSTTRSRAHFDDLRRPVSARAASRDELLALCRATGTHPNTTLAGTFDGALGGFSEDEIELIIEMSRVAGRPMNWDFLTITADDEATVRHQMTMSARARAVGARVVALTMPVPAPMTQSLRDHCMLRHLPGVGPLFAMSIEDRIEVLRDPDVCRRLGAEAADVGPGVIRPLANFGNYLVGDTFAPENKVFEGRRISEIASEQRMDPFSTLVGIALKDDLRTVLWPITMDTPADRTLRAELWGHPDTLFGGSDAGAHLDRMSGASYTTSFLADVVRGNRTIPLEDAILGLTSAPADFFGLRRRGRLAPNYHADVVVFDPATVDADRPRFERDLPSGAGRLVADSIGISHVLVNGVETVRDGRATGALSGAVLRSTAA